MVVRMQGPAGDSSDVRSFLEAAGRFLAKRYRLAPHEEEELRQEVALAVADLIRKGTAVEHREAYARAIARNVAVDWLRRKRHVQSLDELRCGQGEEPTSPSAATPLEALIRSENERFLYAALMGLSGEYRRVLLAVHGEGLKPARIAAMEGIAPKTVYTRLARAEAELVAVLRRRFSTLYRGGERRRAERGESAAYRARRHEWSEGERQVLDLHFLEGKDARSIAAQLLPDAAAIEARIREIDDLIGRARDRMQAGAVTRDRTAGAPIARAPRSDATRLP
ncbi:MAG: sigma-70 family RNA polymerase sigma factor [Planctomycetes bacterium]|nr:sigma-70 family RNA polymerase sigma factor [Planctomycetota bacterium]